MNQTDAIRQQYPCACLSSMFFSAAIGLPFRLEGGEYPLEFSRVEDGAMRRHLPVDAPNEIPANRERREAGS